MNQRTAKSVHGSKSLSHSRRRNWHKTRNSTGSRRYRLGSHYSLELNKRQPRWPAAIPEIRADAADSADAADTADKIPLFSVLLWRFQACEPMESLRRSMEPIALALGPCTSFPAISSSKLTAARCARSNTPWRASLESGILTSEETLPTHSPHLDSEKYSAAERREQQSL